MSWKATLGRVTCLQQAEPAPSQQHEHEAPAAATLGGTSGRLGRRRMQCGGGSQQLGPGPCELQHTGDFLKVKVQPGTA